MDQSPEKQADQREGQDRRQRDDPDYDGLERREKDRRKEPRTPS